MFRTLSYTLSIIALVAATSSAQVRLGAALSGNNEVPPVPTVATGTADITLNEHNNTLTYRVTVTGMVGTVAHIHTGVAGVNGPVLHGLTGGPTIWEGTTPAFTAPQLVALFNGGLYVNVHSSVFPGGEVRGQIVPIVRRPLIANLTGGSEVPPVATAATGTAVLYLNEPINTIDYDVSAVGLIATAAHIHVAPVGVNGPVLRGLTGGPTHWCGTTTPITAAEAATLLTGGCYVNVHTIGNPGGEIRGQVSEQNTLTFVAVLKGSQENPPVVTPATGLATFVLNLSAMTLNYDVTFAGLTGAFTAAHIHTAPQGTNGGVRFGFPAAAAPGFSGTWGPSSSPAFAAADVTNLLNRRFYVNVHSLAFPGGEIRGQIEQNPKVYGLGFTDGAGKRHIDSLGSPVLGNTLTITLTGATPSAPAFLFIESANAMYGGSPLPLFLPGAGYIWVDVTPLTYFPLATDGAGCSSFPIFLPPLPSLRGFTAYCQWLDFGGGGSTSDALKVILQ